MVVEKLLILFQHVTFYGGGGSTTVAFPSRLWSFDVACQRFHKHAALSTSTLEASSEGPNLRAQ